MRSQQVSGLKKLVKMTKQLLLLELATDTSCQKPPSHLFQSGPRLSKLFLSKFQSCARFYIFRAKFQVVHSGPVALGCSCQKSCLPFLVKESKAQTAPLFQLLCISYISYCMMASLCCLSRTNSGVSRVGVQQTQRDEENLALKHL